MKKISVVIPVYNESSYIEKFIPQLVSKLNKLNLEYELIISENGSTDNTFTKAKRLAKRFKRVVVISSPLADYGNAVKKGFLFAKGKFLVLFDLDYWDVPFIIKSLPLMESYDAVVGSKRGVSSQDGRSITRKTSTFVFSLILKVGFGLKISDTHGIKIINRKSFTSIIHKCKMTRDLFDSELLIRGGVEGLRLGELGVRVFEKRKSRSSIMRRAFRTIRDLYNLRKELIKEYGKL